MKNKSLQECLNYIQVNLKAPKNMTNNFGNYSYRNLEGILEGLKPLLEQTGCIINITDSMELVGDRHYIKATASIIKGDESISVDGWARETEVKKGMDESQITGSASSYARKYACNGLFAIDDVKDADSMDNTYTITEGQKAMYQELLNSGAYEGEKQKINKWWKTLTTEPQAKAGLRRMQDHVDNYKEKHKEKG
tara:strand:+ start:1284 stop:1868 length:585 start_codon:yes stop_codon:yes gene_type:complete